MATINNGLRSPIAKPMGNLSNHQGNPKTSSWQITVFDESHYRTNDWSGGTTTELLVFPAKTSYATRDFDFRISSAKVMASPSQFTQLSQYHRHLLVLSGALRLYQNGTSETPNELIAEPIAELATKSMANLMPWQAIEFDGGLAIHSEGQAVDFNVMVRRDWHSELHCLAENERFNVNQRWEHVLCYATVPSTIGFSEESSTENTENLGKQLQGNSKSNVENVSGEISEQYSVGNSVSSYHLHAGQLLHLQRLQRSSHPQSDTQKEDLTCATSDASLFGTLATSELTITASNKIIIVLISDV